MKRLLLAATILVLLSVLPFVIYPILLKIPAGTARILGSRIQVSVRVDGTLQPRARCFYVNHDFRGNSTDYIVLWLPDESGVFGREIVIIQLWPNDVGIPNSSDSDYQLIFDRFLIQSEGGEGYKSIAGPVFDRNNPQIVIAENQYSFVMPGFSGKAPRHVEIDLQ